MINLSERTLRRRLASQSQSLRSLHDATRYERTRDLLQNSGLTMAEVAGLVGYSDARAFRRAFERWSSVLPADFRARALACLKGMPYCRRRPPVPRWPPVFSSLCLLCSCRP